MIVAIVLNILVASSQHPVEYKEISQCKIEKITHRKLIAASEVVPTFTKVGLSLILRATKKETEFVVSSGPIVNPIYDSLANKMYWITLHEVCEINIKTQKARAVYREFGISGIGQIWMSGRSLSIRGGQNDSCIKVDFKKSRVIRTLVSCAYP
jgi:hypothetical protein